MIPPVLLSATAIKLYAATALFAAIVGGVAWYGHAQYAKGEAAAQAKAAARAVEKIEDMERNNAELKKLPRDQLVCELSGGQWLRDNCSY